MPQKADSKKQCPKAQALTKAIATGLLGFGIYSCGVPNMVEERPEKPIVMCLENQIRNDMGECENREPIVTTPVMPVCLDTQRYNENTNMCDDVVQRYNISFSVKEEDRIRTYALGHSKIQRVIEETKNFTYEDQKEVVKLTLEGIENLDNNQINELYKAIEGNYNLKVLNGEIETGQTIEGNIVRNNDQLEYRLKYNLENSGLLTLLEQAYQLTGLDNGVYNLQLNIGDIINTANQKNSTADGHRPNIQINSSQENLDIGTVDIDSYCIERVPFEIGNNAYKVIQNSSNSDCRY